MTYANGGGKVSDPKIIAEVLKQVCESKTPSSVQSIAKKRNLGWNTARAVLMELIVAGKITGTKTAHGWVFYAPGSLREIKVAMS